MLNLFNRFFKIVQMSLLTLILTPIILKAQISDTLVVGSPVLKGARLPVGTETFDSFKLEEGVKTPTSTTTQTITRLNDTYIIHSVHSSANGDTTIGTIIVRENDFALVHHKVKAARDSAAVTCSGGYLTGWVVLPEQPIRLIDLKLSHPVFPVDGPAPWMVTLLPLEENYRAAVPRFNQWAGKETWSNYQVIGSERLERNGKFVDCWKVDVGRFGPPGYRGIRWVDKSSRRVLQSVLHGKPGQTEYWGIAQ